MGLIDFIEAWSGPYRNFSCRNRTLQGFKRCYDYVSGNTKYYDNGFDYKSYGSSKISPSTKKIAKVYETEYIRYYKKRIKRIRVWESITSLTSIIGTIGIIPSVTCALIFFNTTTFIVLGIVLCTTIISLILWKILINKEFEASDPVLDAWLNS